jgi:hypothetical protein
VVFRAAPGVDLFVTGLFYNGDGGFSVITNPLWEWLRQRIWDVAIVVFLASLICWPLALWKGRVARLGARAWGFVLGLFFFGPIVIEWPAQVQFGARAPGRCRSVRRRASFLDCG